MERSTIKGIAAAVCTLAVALCIAAQGATVYVDDDAVGANDGSSWTDAFTYLQDALSVAQDGDEIRVAQGVYTPDRGVGIVPGDREASFHLIRGLTLAGGYAGLTGADPDERDVERYETVLSGDLNGDDGEIADARHLADSPNRDDNCVSAVVGEDVSGSVLDGFTIRDGHWPDLAGGHATDGGGGLRIIRSSLVVRRCTFTRNWGPEGGAIFIRHALGDTETLVEIYDSTFRVNASEEYGGAIFAQGGRLVLADCELGMAYSARGGAIYTAWVDLSLSGCVIRENAALDSGGGLLHIHGNLSVTDCAFVANTLPPQTPSVAGRSSGGAMAINIASNYLVSVADCLFHDNRADFGGAIAGDLGSVERCRFSGNTAYRDGAAFYGSSGLATEQCLFVGNRVLDKGVLIRTDTLLLLTNTTITGNRTPSGSLFRVGGRATANVVVLNSILWDETPMFEDDRTHYMNVSVAYSNVQGGWPGEGNIDADPLFAAPGYWDPDDDMWIDGDYHLKSQAGRWDPISESWVTDDVTSPCIDAGDPRSPIGLEPFPNGGRINMGAYGGTAESSKSYFGGPPCETIMAGDINGDCKVDFADLAILVEHWTEPSLADMSVPMSSGR
jgi:hypothetical protein